MNATQVKSLVLIPKFTGGLSFLGSGAIVWDIVKDRKKKLKNIYHRLLLAMSVGDMFMSLTFVIGTWAIPAGTPGVWLASGTTQTCTAQGFIQQLAAPCFFYNAYLAIYYVLVIRYNYPDKKMIALEKAAHIFSLLFGICTASATARMQLFNSVFLWCWIESIPPGCTDPDECERGRPPRVWTYVFWYIWMWATFGIVVILMIVLVWTIWVTEKKMNKYGESSLKRSIQAGNVAAPSTIPSTPTISHCSEPINDSDAFLDSHPNPNDSNFADPPNPNDSTSVTSPCVGMTSNPITVRNTQTKKNTMLSKVGTQSMLYLTAYFLTNIGNVIYQIFAFGVGVTYAYPALLVIALTLPLQGFWNCLIYFRFRFQKYRRDRGSNS